MIPIRSDGHPKHIDKMCWGKTVDEYCAEEHKSNEFETSFNQHSIKCVLCEEKHVTWSFQCPKRSKKKNRIIAKNAKTAELYTVRMTHSVPQQNQRITENVYSTSNNTTCKKGPSGWKTITKKNESELTLHLRVSTSWKWRPLSWIQWNLILKKKSQDSAKRSVNCLKKSMQISQTMFVNTQSKNSQFSINKIRVAVGVWKPLVIFKYLQVNYWRKFIQWRNLYAYISRIYE